MNVRGAALPAGRAVPQMQVHQVQPAELTDTQASISQPGHRDGVAGAVHRGQQPLPCPVRQHLRMPAVRAPGSQRVRRHLALHMAQERARPIGPGRQPAPVELPAQIAVHPERSLVQIEPFQAGRRRGERGLAVRTFPDPPWLAQRHRHLRSDDAHIPLEVPQRHRLNAEALTVQPPQVIHQQIGVGPLGPRPVMTAQEPVRLAVHPPLRPHDRPRPKAVPPRQLLNPELTDHNLPSHMPSIPMPANMTDDPDQVGK